MKVEIARQRFETFKESHDNWQRTLEEACEITI